MPTIAQHITARDDANLHVRLVAAAEMAGIPAAAQWVAENAGVLVCTQIGDTTIADVHAYAVSQQAPPPLPPGADPAFITDAQLKAAVCAVHGT